MLVGTRTASPRPGAEGFAPVHARVNLTSPVRTASIGGHGMAWDRTRYRSRSIAGVCAIPLVLLAFGAVAAEAATTRPRPADPVRVSSAAADSLRAAYAHDRAGTEKNLKEGATSYLAAVARTDFDERTALVVGRAADCDLHVDDPALAAPHLRGSVGGDAHRHAAPELHPGGPPGPPAVAPALPRAHRVRPAEPTLRRLPRPELVPGG